MGAVQLRAQYIGAPHAARAGKNSVTARIRGRFVKRCGTCLSGSLSEGATGCFVVKFRLYFQARTGLLPDIE
jgi:hypothetical protein